MTWNRYSADASPLSTIWEGMPVVDSTGASIGKVEYVKMGDAQAATPRGQMPPGNENLFSVLAQAFTGAEPQVGRQAAERMIRIGYFKVDAAGLFDRDFYVAADQVAYTADDHVRLSVPAGDLTEER